jgi:hypothetical protein
MSDIQNLKLVDKDFKKIIWLMEDEFGDLLYYIIRKKPVR